MNELFGAALFESEDFIKLMVRFGLNLFFALIIIRSIFYNKYLNRDYVFVYILFNVITFLICFLLRKVKMEMGFALGLFAVFGVLRYRTEAIKIKEMTYLFIVIGLAMVNALANKSISWSEILFANAGIAGITYIVDKLWVLKEEAIREIVYERIDMIKPEMHDELMKDLKERTGLDIHHFTIQDVDFLRDIARIEIRYYESEKNSYSYKK